MNKRRGHDDSHTGVTNEKSFTEVMHRALKNVTAQVAKATDESRLEQWWDAFWVENPDAGDMGAAETSILVPVLRRRKFRRILCVGNGKSCEAHALAAAGFDADALDVSPVANRFLETLTVPREVLEKILKEPCPESAGLPAIHTGDVRNDMACPGPYDVVIARRMLQYFDEDAVPEVMTALCKRLSETGLVVLEDHNITSSLRAAVSWLRKEKIPTALNVCVKDGRVFAPPALNSDLDRRAAWLIRSSG